MNKTDKTRENRLRRMAQRQGLRLVKSSRRDPKAVDYGKYMILYPAGSNAQRSDSQGFSLTLDDVERIL